MEDSKELLFTWVISFNIYKFEIKTEKCFLKHVHKHAFHWLSKVMK